VKIPAAVNRTNSFVIFIMIRLMDTHLTARESHMGVIDKN
jgi:hypothetical protein